MPNEGTVNHPAMIILFFTGLNLVVLSEDAEAQKLPIPDNQTREQPDGCLVGPSDYGPPPYSVFRDTEDYTYLRDPKKHDDPKYPVYSGADSRF